MKRAIIPSILVLILLMPALAWATAQEPDLLIYKGKTESILANPLEQYFESGHPRPAGHMEATCSAIWRGYVATWKIDNDKLYLIRVVEGSCSDDAPEIPLAKIFPDKKAPIFADWYSGTLIIPKGKTINYVHMGYESTYENELHITIKDGRVQGTAKVDNRKPRKQNQ